MCAVWLYSCVCVCVSQVLDASENKSIKQQIKEHVTQLVGRGKGSGGSSDPAEVLSRCRDLAMKVKVPEVVRKDLEKAMKKAGG